MIVRAHAMIDQLEMELGSLDYLCFAFPQVRGGLSILRDPSAFVAGAIKPVRQVRYECALSTPCPRHGSTESQDVPTYAIETQALFGNRKGA